MYSSILVVDHLLLLVLTSLTNLLSRMHLSIILAILWKDTSPPRGYLHHYQLQFNCDYYHHYLDIHSPSKYKINLIHSKSYSSVLLTTFITTFYLTAPATNRDTIKIKSYHDPSHDKTYYKCYFLTQSSSNTLKQHR